MCFSTLLIYKCTTEGCNRESAPRQASIDACRPKAELEKQKHPPWPCSICCAWFSYPSEFCRNLTVRSKVEGFVPKHGEAVEWEHYITRDGVVNLRKGRCERCREEAGEKEEATNAVDVGKAKMGLGGDDRGLGGAERITGEEEGVVMISASEQKAGQILRTECNDLECTENLMVQRSEAEIAAAVDDIARLIPLPEDEGDGLIIAAVEQKTEPKLPRENGREIDGDKAGEFREPDEELPIVEMLEDEVESRPERKAMIFETESVPDSDIDDEDFTRLERRHDESPAQEEFDLLAELAEMSAEKNKREAEKSREIDDGEEEAEEADGCLFPFTERCLHYARLFKLSETTSDTIKRLANFMKKIRMKTGLPPHACAAAVILTASHIASPPAPLAPRHIRRTLSLSRTLFLYAYRSLQVPPFRIQDHFDTRKLPKHCCGRPHGQRCPSKLTAWGRWQNKCTEIQVAPTSDRQARLMYYDFKDEMMLRYGPRFITMWDKRLDEMKTGQAYADF
ncbi:Hypothetical predicted protein [Lecanosticta acicola]|uniref:Uncharacterized protein n=1 Tax=Lecanosticta acicola TaxID=111012 RepID=A0AAI8Z866_9PEZI|nr:Hypothetical predicted protein [Lecanosticta acicola]